MGNELIISIGRQLNIPGKVDNEWMCRVIYSIAGQMGLASLWDYDEDEDTVSIHQRFQYIGNNNGIPDSDAQGAHQRQPAQHTAHLPGCFSTGGPGIAVGPQGAGGRPPPHGEFRRKADIAEDKDKQQIDQQESPAAIAAQFVGETPYIGHSYRRTDRGQNEAPPAGKAPCAFLMFHFIFSVSIKQAVPCGRLAAPCYFSALHRKSQHSPARYSKYPQKYA